MWHHFWDSSMALEAVVAGDLDGVKTALGRLAASEHGDEIPADWLPWLEDMKAEAGRGAQSDSLAVAATSVAALGAQCGECHRATRGGPEFTGDERGYSAFRRGGLEEKMARHLWSAKELWLGLSGPVHQAWSRGAAGLMNIQVPAVVDHRGASATEERAPTGEGTLAGGESAEGAEAAAGGEAKAGGNTIDMDAALREIRELGKQADQAGMPKQKQTVFAEIIGRCGGCHSELGVKVPRTE